MNYDTPSVRCGLSFFFCFVCFVEDKPSLPYTLWMRIRGRGCKVVAPARIFSRYDESFLSFFFTTQRTSRLATGYNYKRARHAYSVPRVTRPPATIDDPTTAHIPSCLLSCLKVWEFRLVVSNEDFHLVGFPYSRRFKDGRTFVNDRTTLLRYVCGVPLGVISPG